MVQPLPLESPLESGALKLDRVLRILKTGGVIVASENDMTTLSKGDVSESYRLGPIVHRRMINRFSRVFGVDIAKFYN